MFAAKWYIAFMLACLLQVSLALPMPELAAREPEAHTPSTEGSGGTSQGPDW
ncbi:hypothetical protein M405DRAFT_804855 [Rhizopogon salebrosus TDB-379]|nr:hypothetical protein M405DRAFT_804855 [Rhizopogon salebrosus TDB-379]